MSLKQSLSTSEKFQLWAESAELADLKAALTSLNLIYQKRITIKPLHPNQFKKLNNVERESVVVTYQHDAEPDDTPIDENRVYLMMIRIFIHNTEYDFGMYLRKVKRAFRAANTITHCPQCRVPMTTHSMSAPTQLTVDHIIPVWVCTKLNYFQGIVDPNNLRIMCFRCNSERGTAIRTISDLRKELGNKRVDAFFRRVNAYLPLTASYLK